MLSQIITPTGSFAPTNAVAIAALSGALGGLITYYMLGLATVAEVGRGTKETINPVHCTSSL